VWVTGVPDRVIGKCFGTPLGRKRDRDLYSKILGISAPWRVAQIEPLAMDMWRPQMNAAATWLPKARVCYDRFHETGAWLVISAKR
jgi:hypothetical protein